MVRHTLFRTIEIVTGTTVIGDFTVGERNGTQLLKQHAQVGISSLGAGQGSVDVKLLRKLQGSREF